jgi:hypothetical protein
MGRSTKPRKSYRPAPVTLNAHQVAMARVHTLRADDAQRQVRLLRTALAEFKRGLHCVQHWLSLADAANVAETLAQLGIGSGPQATQVIGNAQRALSDVQLRHQAGHSWTLHAAEMAALAWLVDLHALQLTTCDYSEFERALDLTRNRIAQARAGNAPAGALIIEGEIA